VIDFLAGLDVSIFRALNNFCGWNPWLDHIIFHGEKLLKGTLFIGIFGVLWHWPDKDMPRRRETFVLMMPAVALSLVVNRAISTLLPFRYRPMYSIGANAPAFEWRPDLENWSSFPSDNATFFFAIAMGLWLISKRWGLFFGVFATFVSLARVYQGLHYPGDVLVGALIGISISLAVIREPVRKLIAAPILALEPRYPPYFYGVLFLALAELSAGFPDFRILGVAVVHLYTGVPPTSDLHSRTSAPLQQQQQQRHFEEAAEPSAAPNQ
jgi:undecaprenyl-diphosphatase